MQNRLIKATNAAALDAPVPSASCTSTEVTMASAAVLPDRETLTFVVVVTLRVHETQRLQCHDNDTVIMIKLIFNRG